MLFSLKLECYKSRQDDWQQWVPLDPSPKESAIMIDLLVIDKHFAKKFGIPLKELRGRQYKICKTNISLTNMFFAKFRLRNPLSYCKGWPLLGGVVLLSFETVDEIPPYYHSYEASWAEHFYIIFSSRFFHWDEEFCYIFTEMRNFAIFSLCFVLERKRLGAVDKRVWEHKRT